MPPSTPTTNRSETRPQKQVLRELIFMPEEQRLLMPAGLEESVTEDWRSNGRQISTVRKDLGPEPYKLYLFHYPRDWWPEVYVLDAGMGSASPFPLSVKIQLFLTAEDRQQWQEVIEQNGLAPDSPDSKVIARFNRCMQETEWLPDGRRRVGRTYYKLEEIRPEHPRASGTASRTIKAEPVTTEELPATADTELSAPVPG